MKYKDYYNVLGVSRDASADEIRKAYRRLARKYHPDVSKGAGSEERFKDIAEAYEVLGDPAKRKRYDQVGAGYSAGQDFTPPPGWENAEFDFSGAAPGRAGGFRIEDFGGFSDFFESLFGGVGGFRRGGQTSGRSAGVRGSDHEAELTIDLRSAYRGGIRSVTLESGSAERMGRGRTSAKTYKVRIPAGALDGARIRLSGQGGAGVGGGAPGDLYLRLKIAPDPVFRLQGRDIEVDVPVTPWEAALGGKVEVPTLDGPAMLSIGPGTQCGQRFRLRGKGMPGSAGRVGGDLYAVIKIVVPGRLSERERSLFLELARVSTFKPRAE